MGGDFLITASMDQTCRAFDMQSMKCRQTFRGHVDSVNYVTFQPYSNNVITASGDKTVSLWDLRSGLCVQTFYGHSNACNGAVFNIRGDQIASCDSDGIVKLWMSGQCRSSYRLTLVSILPTQLPLTAVE